MPDLSGKLVLVTGAASGIGQGCCELCKAEGATVLATDVRPVTHSFADSSFTCDVSKEDSVQSLLRGILSAYNRPVDGVLHCAGVLVSVEGLSGCTADVFDRVFSVNMRGTYLINRLFIEAMKEHNIKGSVVNVSSIAVNGSSKCPAYAASKAAQVGWTKSLAKELGPSGIRCNTVHPGNIDTPFACNSHIDEALLQQPELRPNVPLGVAKVEKRLENLLHNPKEEEMCVLCTPYVGRLGTPADVAQVCVFLLSDRARYVTGSEYEVHGGCQINL